MLDLEIAGEGDCSAERCFSGNIIYMVLRIVAQLYARQILLMQVGEPVLNQCML